MTLPVFIDPALSVDGDAHVAVGGVLEAPAGIAHHAVTVRRMRAGEGLELSDGSGLRITGTIVDTGGNRLRVRVERMSQEPQPRPRLVLVQALAKSGRDLAALEAAVEVGVDHVIPWEAQRSIVKWPAAKAAKSLAKWRHTSAAAAEQSRRAVVPTVAEVVRGTDLADAFGPTDAVFVLHEAASRPLTECLRHLADGSGCERVVFVVGPEGGVSDAEIAALSAVGAQPVLLGPTVLRASTAGPVALGLCQAALGRW